MESGGFEGDWYSSNNGAYTATTPQMHGQIGANSSYNSFNSANITSNGFDR